jgi:hypothetical protein
MLAYRQVALPRTHALSLSAHITHTHTHTLSLTLSHTLSLAHSLTHSHTLTMQLTLSFCTRTHDSPRSNFNNVERVYLAEQKDIAEKRKIAELMKERAEQSRIEDLQAHAVSTGAVKKKQERVEFLYQGSAPSVDCEVRAVRAMLCR